MKYSGIHTIGKERGQGYVATKEKVELWKIGNIYQDAYCLFYIGIGKIYDGHELVLKVGAKK